jgi:hypothetical protein
VASLQNRHNNWRARGKHRAALRSSLPRMRQCGQLVHRASERLLRGLMSGTLRHRGEAAGTPPWLSGCWKGWGPDTLLFLIH